MRYLSELYNATFKKIRGKAKQNFIRPTLCEFLMTHKDFIEIPKYLTWPGSTHTEDEVLALGGEVFDTGNGTIGRVPLSSVPEGWTQADNWQRYSISSWGGDVCGNHKSTAPTVWSNTQSVSKSKSSKGAYLGEHYCGFRSYYWHSKTYEMHGLLYEVITHYNTSSNRVEIGIY
jgi:hypothetical protein